MIKIIIKKEDNYIKYVEVKGHANYSESGSDIVCAAASSILITTVNAILSFNDQAITYKSSEGYASLEVNDFNEHTEKLLINMVNMFKGLESDYPKNIQIR